jgi:hypothetical protein
MDEKKYGVWYKDESRWTSALFSNGVRQSRYDPTALTYQQALFEAELLCKKDGRNSWEVREIGPKKEGIRIDIKAAIKLMPIENDFVCPKCGNDKYSQLEYNNKIACWMCGELG